MKFEKYITEKNYVIKKERYAEKRGDTGPFHDIFVPYDLKGKKLSNKLFTSKSAAESFARKVK